MKLSNQDVTRLTEIRIYFREPPYSFKLSGYALLQVEESITILKKYPSAPADLLDKMEVFRALFQSTENNIAATMEHMKEFAILLNEINR
ncbi:hypothetical protein SAMN05518672_103754 [Chitinophaga sp. CF118]|uniref:hypothetical protein n=1 Tax=Chitinophaga sp. CF118 TaxID=1884367 RepID=UPI0008E398D3|nr:hypothetical protein [Chitinophaga sp. CF118]SFD89692.1 hypothetical protein SAMN05518672_103754 [Chitinophaga sp. CF118]